MADFSEFAAFVPATLPTPSPQVNRVEELVQEICHVIKDRVVETGANEIDHDKEDFKTFEGIERCLAKYRETCRNKIDEYLSELPVPIREYAEQKLLFAHKKSPGQVLQALQSRLKEVVAEFMPKLSKAYETSSLVCNYLLDPREFRNFLTNSQVQASTSSAHVCRTPYCFSVYEKGECAAHLSTHSLTPNTRALFLSNWVKTDDRLWRSCNICGLVGQFVPQHLKNVHGITGEERKSTFLSHMLTDVGLIVSTLLHV